jgi:predicted TIM-barrel fold metal-dependent hydrolase
LKDSMRLSRRQFLRRTSTGLAIAGVAGGSAAASESPAPQGKLPTAPPAASQAPARGVAIADVGRLLKSYRIWDVHTHLNRFAGATTEEKVDDCLRWADRMGVERMMVLTAASGGRDPDAEALRKMNDECIKAVKKAPDRLFGCAFMNPNYLQASIDEINRCVGDGPLVGLKFEFDTIRLASSPEMDPIIARIGELHGVVMQHTFIQSIGNFPGESTPMELAVLARRHPSVTIFCGHTGGTWEVGVRGMRGVPNLYSDLSGSDSVSGFAEMAVRELGPEHVLYGSDIQGRSYASQISKVLGANLPDSTRRLILGGNMRHLMEPVMKARGMKI